MNIRDFAKFTLDYFSSITLTDIEESDLNGSTFNNETVKKHPYFFELFTSAYLKGLEEEGLR